MAYFDCIVGGSGKGNTLVVTCADDLAGATITCTNGTKTYTKTCPSTAPYEVTFYGLAAGTYTVSATVSGDTYTTTVVVADYEAELGGFNWKAWVDLSENYTSSGFTDLDDLLSDETAVRELMTIHACVDYLAGIAAESADVETIINNDLAAKWINNRDYALDTLYANEIIAGYMDTADKYGYGEWCLMPQVPTMTSNTAPYGECFGSTVGSGYDYYMAFDKTLGASNYWYSEGATNQSIGYKFTTPQRISKVRIIALYSTVARLKNFKIQARNTGDNWVDIYTGQYPNTQDYVLDVSINPSSAYDEYQLYCVDTHSSANYIAIQELQFYAWQPKGNVPIMTANNAPYGEVLAGVPVSDQYGPLYYAFDGNDNTFPYQSGSENFWTSGSGTQDYVRYHFANPVCIKRITSLCYTRSGGGYPISDFKEVYYGSNDNTNWELIYQDENWKTSKDDSTTPADKATINIPNNNTYYSYIKHGVLLKNACWDYKVRTLQFYGRELSVSVPVMTSNTAPFGEASADGATSGYEAYKAFDNDDSTYWHKLNPGYIQFEFPSNTRVLMFSYKGYAVDNTVKDYTLYGVDGGSTKEIKSGSLTNTANLQTISVDNPSAYKKYRLQCRNFYDFNITNPAIKALQFYGFDYSEKEFETGTTKKWLYDHGVELEEMTPLTSGNSSNVVEKKDNEVYMYKVGTNSAAGIYSPLIDLSDYSLLRAKMGDKSYSSNSGEVSAAMLCISSSTPIDAANMSNVTSYSDYYNSATQGNLPNNLSLDTSSYNEGKYLSFVARSAGNFTKYSTCTELWLE